MSKEKDFIQNVNIKNTLNKAFDDQGDSSKRINEQNEICVKKLKRNEDVKNLETTCVICKQDLCSVKTFEYNPQMLDEAAALFHPTFNQNSVFNSLEAELKVVKFCLYDANRHMCRIDSGLIEEGVELFLAGTLQPLYMESIESCAVEAKDCGPVLAWSSDIPRNPLITVNTNLGTYVLIQPLSDYKFLFDRTVRTLNLHEKILKFITETEADNIDKFFVNMKRKGDLTVKNDVMREIKYIKKLFRFNVEPSIIRSSCYRSLLKLSRQMQENKLMSTPERRTYATNQVFQVFKNYFSSEIEGDNLKCITGKDDSSGQKFEEISTRSFPKSSEKTETYDADKCKKWFDITNKIFVLGNDNITPGCFVELENVDGNKSRIVFVRYYEEKSDGEYSLHCTRLCKSNETLLQEEGDEKELFWLNKCLDVLVEKIKKKINVQIIELADGSLHINKTSLEDVLESRNYFVQKRYDNTKGRFEDPITDCCLVADGVCYACKHRDKEEEMLTPRPRKIVLQDTTDGVRYEEVIWMNQVYKIGSGVYITPSGLNSEPKKKKMSLKYLEELNEEFYPEVYRRMKKTKGWQIPPLLDIGVIADIYVKSTDVWLKIIKMYRPSNVSSTNCDEADLNLLYWSNNVMMKNFKNIEGKCYIKHFESYNQKLIDEWTSRGTNRFYFLESLKDPKSKNLRCSKKKLQNAQKPWEILEKCEEHPETERKLRTMDLFCGCGGLSEGLRSSGVADIKFAVDINANAALAFQNNHPNCSTKNYDCNDLIRKLERGHFIDFKTPEIGDIDMIVGGTPCQGFSNANKHKDLPNSRYSNSLVVTFLSFCEYYRPSYILLENVPSIATCDRSIVLKLAAKSLLRMGYQCTMGLLQAGHFGVPQARRRFFLMAAAPGRRLPDFPLPQHVFDLRQCNLNLRVDQVKFVRGQKWLDGGRNGRAPLRNVTVKDAISDLPPNIEEGNTVASYEENRCMSHYQRLARIRSTELTNHVCEKMSCLMKARIKHIPLHEGCDWRDLPNIEIALEDGTVTKKLVYKYNDSVNGKSRNGQLRGVCACAEGRNCKPEDRQENTLIPWSLVHSSNKNNNWKGVFGRVNLSGYFQCLMTDTNPLKKQGRVLHPSVNRILSIRECARAQGFPDHYFFHGSPSDMFEEIGNAVPPPLANAIGLEIMKTLPI